MIGREVYQNICGKSGVVVSIAAIDDDGSPTYIRVRWKSGQKTWIRWPSKILELKEGPMTKPVEVELAEYKAMWNAAVSAAKAELEFAERELRELNARVEKAEGEAEIASRRVAELLAIADRNNSDLKDLPF